MVATTKFVGLTLADKPGTLAAVTRNMANARVNIEGFAVERGFAYFLVQDPQQAYKALRDAGYYTVKLIDVFDFTLPNRPGLLADLTEQLAKAKVNVDTTFGLAGGPAGRIFMAVSDMKKAAPILERVVGNLASVPGN